TVQQDREAAVVTEVGVKVAVELARNIQADGKRSNRGDAGTRLPKVTHARRVAVGNRQARLSAEGGERVGFKELGLRGESARQHQEEPEKKLFRFHMFFIHAAGSAGGRS